MNTSDNETNEENKMTLQQGIELGKAAKNAGYVIAVKNGKVQFQTVEFKANGVSVVTPHTDWIDYEEAMEIIAG